MDVLYLTHNSQLAVDVKLLLSQLMDRLSKHAASTPEVSDSFKACEHCPLHVNDFLIILSFRYYQNL